MLSANQPISENLPAHGCRHVAIIMDGNGRWAKRQGKIRAFGHKAGAKSVRRAVSFAANNGIDALTLYAFSSENWNRPLQEVTALMELFVWALDSEVKSLHRHNVRLRPSNRGCFSVGCSCSHACAAAMIFACLTGVTASHAGP